MNKDISSQDLLALEFLHEVSTPARWAAFMALAKYLEQHPEQRLGQAVVNALYPTHEAAQTVTEEIGGVEAILDTRTLEMPQPALFYLPDEEAATLATSRRS